MFIIISERIDVYAVVDVYFLLHRQESILCRISHCQQAGKLIAVGGIDNLETACGLLKTSRKQVSEICFAVVFNDLPHFDRVFKKEYGVTPSQFRASNQS